jgi:hypothetical protein
MAGLSLKKRVNKHSIQMMYMYKLWKRDAGNDQWLYLSERQAFRDSLESMKRCGLIQDYDLEKFTITTMDDKIIGENHGL